MFESVLRGVRGSTEAAVARFVADRADEILEFTRELIRTNLDRRIFNPFRDMIQEKRRANWWLSGKNNWNAVCLAGVTGSALATLESREERAWFIAATEVSVQNFLSGFTPDGYCSEGVGYWNYGFGHYVMLAETVRRNTGGKLDMLASAKAARPALFGARTEILNDIYPSIADCSPGSQPSPVLMAYLTSGVLSLGSLVGLLTILGIATRNGIMMISHFQHLEEEEDVPFGPGLVLRGAQERIAPIMMTALTTGLALVPLIIRGNIPGQEIEYPMAIVILCGLVTSTLLNMIVVPALYLRYGAPAAHAPGPPPM